MDIISGYARFSGPNEVILEDGRSLKFRKCILGTGVTYSQLRLCVDFLMGKFGHQLRVLIPLMLNFQRVAMICCGHQKNFQILKKSKSSCSNRFFRPLR